MDGNRKIIVIPVHVHSVKHKIFTGSFVEKLLKQIKEKEDGKKSQ